MKAEVGKIELLFVNKKKQKNFDSYGLTEMVPPRREAEHKLFAEFFKKGSSCCLLYNTKNHQNQRAARH
jgi:hypothetical protein